MNGRRLAMANGIPRNSIDIQAKKVTRVSMKIVSGSSTHNAYRISEFLKEIL